MTHGPEGRPALRHITRKDYDTLVDAIDTAFKVFEEISENPETALRAFIENHYFSYWKKVT